MKTTILFILILSCVVVAQQNEKNNRKIKLLSLGKVQTFHKEQAIPIRWRTENFPENAAIFIQCIITEKKHSLKKKHYIVYGLPHNYPTLSSDLGCYMWRPNKKFTDDQKLQIVVGYAEIRPFSLFYPEVDGFRYSGFQTYSVAGHTHSVHEYIHEKTQLEFVLIPKGSFTMGTGSGDQTPQKKVHVSSFLIAKREVSKKLWDKVVRKIKSTESDSKKSDPKKPDPMEPKTMVSWKQAQLFCKKTGLQLPSEAQWEYAYRGNNSFPYFWQEKNQESTKEKQQNQNPNQQQNQNQNQQQILSAKGYVWYDQSSDRCVRRVDNNIKSNAFGLKNMAGNVREWCADYYSSKYTTDQVDPIAPWVSDHRVVRGGCVFSSKELCSANYRFFYSETYRAPNLGFRPCFNLEK
ncbi:formylglycine-generating enzyme family protein [Candidatus Uabimicrobium sp. HlEnr_7]|uniref:formylglycine-generating enzyme family protein n=1 Tax=Candidatus Uabimicrobium helgolandensis TaxID=3095367 RepID=UPI0035576671